MSIKSSASSKQSLCNNTNSQFSREQKKIKAKEKTKSWCQLKRLYAELPPQVNTILSLVAKSLEIGVKLNYHMNSCCSHDKTVLWL